MTKMKMKTAPTLSIVLLIAAVFLPASPLCAQGIIYVTSLEDKISATGGCSLKEAIYSANLDNNQAVDSVGTDPVTGMGVPHIITTECLPGNGDDTIVLPTGAVLNMSQITGDLDNPFGPTATPLITSVITIQAHGAELKWVGTDSARAFSVGSTGNLTIQDVHIDGFSSKGGNGGDGGGGGGMGAGGAIFVHAGTLVLTSSTLESNSVSGGNGAADTSNGGGGGGGLSGNGGTSAGQHCTDGSGNSDHLIRAGGGGGGSRGNGGDAFGCSGAPGGGGTVYPDETGEGGQACGGAHTPVGVTVPIFGSDGHDAPCPGGGGGAGAQGLLSSGNGGAGNYGGGGGGGAAGGGNGGNGGFGGGGGSGWTGDLGGTRGGGGGFGGGGGSAANGNIGGGHPGVGGAFGGDSNSLNGGGGAGLGGAIFNDSGTIFVQNSTFNGNVAVRGNGGGAGTPDAADNGADAGAAIFSHNGSTTLQHVTISGNETTGGGGGVYVYQDPSLPGPTSLNIYNSIIARNGAGFAAPNECVVSGSSVATDGSGNLILDNGGCPGVVTGSDPNLAPLQNNGGFTPTMAIPKTSPAFNAADPSHATNRDQRNIFRPQVGAPDIGAFELCVAANPILAACEVPTVINPDPMANLTIVATPLTGGTTNPSPGVHPVLLDSVSVIHAIPTAGNTFLGWLGTVTDSTNPLTTVIMNQDQTVTAQFSGLTTTISGNITGKSGPANARDWTLSLTNNGPAGADAIIPSFTLAQTFGVACTPHVSGPFPLVIPTLSAGQTGSADVLIDFTGCAANVRFTATFTFSANNGTVTGTVVRTNQFE